MNIREKLGRERLFFDGGTGTLLQAQGLKGGELPETWNLLYPERIAALHRAYLEAGADIICTNTFGANALKFPAGGQFDLEAIVKAGVEIARSARAEVGREADAYIALDMGPTGKLLKPMGELDFEDAVSLYAQVVRIGAAAGADLVIIETMSDSYEAKAAVRAAKENCDLPVIVTTAVQFFESLYSCRPSQCRKIHNIAQSIVVFDEAQMLPLHALRPCIWAIAQLVKHYGVSAVLCTATQPALTPIFREFAPELPVTELCPPEQFQWDVFQRVTFRQAGKLTYEELAAQLQKQEQVLCIVNSRKSAQEIFLRLEGEGCFHLSTLMYPAHRRAKLEEIRRRLDKGLPCRVVSTSLIEAGVDVDFPAVYREEAGLDSILQAAGRCNREGKRPLERSIVTVFQGEGSTPPLFAAAVGAGRDAMAHYEDITSPEAVHAYFTRLLDLKGAEAQDVQQILPLMQSELFPFRTVSERFHLIDSPTVTVYIPKDEGAELVERLRSGEHSRNLYRQLGQYGVSIYEQHFNALDQAGDLERLEDGSVILSSPDLYSEYTGLSMKADSGKGLFI